MFDQPGGLICDTGSQRGADVSSCGEYFEGSLSNLCDVQVQHDLGNFNDFCSVEPTRHQGEYCGGKTFHNYSDCSVIPHILMVGLFISVMLYHRINSGKHILCKVRVVEIILSRVVTIVLSQRKLG